MYLRKQFSIIRQNGQDSKSIKQHSIEINLELWNQRRQAGIKENLKTTQILQIKEKEIKKF